MKLSIFSSECDCEICSKMCKAPCCGTPEDFVRLIDSGYGSRLMLDDYSIGEDDPVLIKPALKGYTGKKAPWETSTERGCTFWKKGKCELHAKGLKPSQGKLAKCGQSWEQTMEIADFIRSAWKEGKGDKIIQEWKDRFLNKKTRG